MKFIKSKKGIRLAIGIVSGVLLGILTSNIALWLPIGIASGVGLDKYENVDIFWVDAKIVFDLKTK